jgi:hypothetical protein
MSSPSSLPSFVVVLQQQRRHQFVAIAFFSMFKNKKNTTIDSISFFDGFDAKKNDKNCGNLVLWFCCKKGDSNNIITYFYGGSPFHLVN